MGVLLREEARAHVAAGLLVREQGEDHVAGQRGALLLRAEERGDEHRDRSLHVHGAATPDVTVHELAAERRPRPVLARGRDDVDVALEEQRRLVASREPGNEVRAARNLRVDLGVDPGLLEEPAYEVDALRFVSRRIGGVEADQPLEELTGAQRDVIAASRPSTSSAVL